MKEKEISLLEVVRQQERKRDRDEKPKNWILFSHTRLFVVHKFYKGQEIIPLKYIINCNEMVLSSSYVKHNDHIHNYLTIV
ncbi:Hypothetical predicted protein [Octopus vulgaris]|uniref:Uncharacterized protein n=1 Tax=Octopus vulgaris TaxID=6645 RepID=A0AA36FBR9_OCTVU|nr:Hypothetical predicted protein [Octopus vulgaris]